MEASVTAKPGEPPVEEAPPVTALVDEPYWFAKCGCGWTTEASNDSADTCMYKVRTHLRTHLVAFHGNGEADVVITGVIKKRQIGTVPYGQPPPDPKQSLNAALARLHTA